MCAARQSNGCKTVTVSLSLLVLGIGLAGCQSYRPTTATGWSRVTRTTTITSAPMAMPAEPVAEPEPTPPPEPEPAAEPLNTGDGVVIAKSIQEACGLSDEELRDAKFGLNSTKLNAGGVSLLESVATCIKDGKLQAGTIELVGFTDDRGSAEYNMKLGKQRAQAAQAVLTSRGVPSNRLKVDSRGEEEATGTDEATRALDRRVEIRLIEE
jgi:outer membrane protein OmpA-like peptidoglycan-associated protein